MNMEILQQILGMAETVQMFIPMLHEVVEKYQPVLNDVVGEVVEVYDGVTNNPKLYNVVARNKKMQYDAYIDNGFTPEQAMLFLLGNENAAANTINSFVRMIPSAVTSAN